MEQVTSLSCIPYPISLWEKPSQQKNPTNPTKQKMQTKDPKQKKHKTNPI